MNIISRQEAKSKGIEFYFTGKSCKHGHIALRKVNNKKCTECIKIENSSESKKRYMTEYRKQNRQKIREINLAYRLNNKEKIAAKDKRYYESHGKLVYQRRKEYFSNLYRNNIHYRLRVNIRGHIKRSIRNITGLNIRGSVTNCGYTVKQLKDHIENNFIEGMSWDNQGEWHIDHRVPISDFISRGITEPSIINALDNLRPMWKKHNLMKNNKSELDFFTEHPEIAKAYSIYIR